MILGAFAASATGHMADRQQPTARADLGDFTHAADVGQPTLAGSTTYDPERQTYTLRASGANIWDATATTNSVAARRFRFLERLSIT